MKDQTPCDAGKCPAAAAVYLEKAHGLSLAFCGHDFDQRVVELFAQGWAVRDDTRPALRAAEAARKSPR